MHRGVLQGVEQREYLERSGWYRAGGVFWEDEGGAGEHSKQEKPEHMVTSGWRSISL